MEFTESGRARAAREGRARTRLRCLSAGVAAALLAAFSAVVVLAETSGGYLVPVLLLTLLLCAALVFTSAAAVAHRRGQAAGDGGAADWRWRIDGDGIARGGAEGGWEVFFAWDGIREVTLGPRVCRVQCHNGAELAVPLLPGNEGLEAEIRRRAGGIVKGKGR